MAVEQSSTSEQEPQDLSQEDVPAVVGIRPAAG